MSKCSRSVHVTDQDIWRDRSSSISNERRFGYFNATQRDDEALVDIVVNNVQIARKI